MATNDKKSEESMKDQKKPNDKKDDKQQMDLVRIIFKRNSQKKILNIRKILMTWLQH